MKRSLYGAVCALALMTGGFAVGLVAKPAQAQTDVSFDSFHDQLADYGDWVYSDRWGEVWMPDAPPDFQPYGTRGYWADTDDYGWTWVSDYPWGDIPFHYGRWVNDPDDGWMWIPGYVWSPGWVVWRSNEQMTGWMPMPPDRRFLSGDVDIGPASLNVSIDFGNTGDFYGYRSWYGPSYSDAQFNSAWVFVGTDHFADHDFMRYRTPPANAGAIIRNTTNITNYTVVNNTIINKSVNVAAVERASGHQIQPVRAAQVLHKPALITHVDQGRQAQEAMRAATPHGTGAAGSAPPPSPAAVNGLSNKVTQHQGHPAAHVYTKATIDKAPVNGAANRAPVNGAAPPAAANLRQPPPPSDRRPAAEVPARPAAETPARPAERNEAAPQARPSPPAPERRPEAEPNRAAAPERDHPVAPRPEEPRVPAAKPEPAHAEPARPVAPHPEPPRPETPRAEPPRAEPQRAAPQPQAKPPAKEEPKKDDHKDDKNPP